MWLHKLTLKISWIKHINDQAILNGMKKEKEILKTVKSRKLEYLVQIMKNSSQYELLQLQGKILGKKGSGRRRTSWIKNLGNWFNMTKISLYRAAVNGRRS